MIKRFPAWIAIATLLTLRAWGAASDQTASALPLEERIREAYSRSEGSTRLSRECDGLDQSLSAADRARLRANLLALLGACVTETERARKLFTLAESKDPYNDLVAALHARRLQSIDPAKAQPYWTKVMRFGRNESLRDIARESLSGLHEGRFKLHLTPWTWSADAKVGASYHTDPRVEDLPWRVHRDQWALDAELSLGLQHWINAGSVSVAYKGELAQFPTAQEISTQSHHLETPVAFRVGKSEDLVVIPFFGFDQVGGKPLGNQWGFGFRGMAYRETHRQSVSGYAASESTLLPNVGSPKFAHYHFDYRWEWFPRRWYLLAQFSFDNISASRISRIFNTLGDFNQSHNDLTLEWTARRGFNRVSLGLSGTLKARLDARDSSVPRAGGGAPEIFKRNDVSFALRPHLIWRVLNQLEATAYFEQRWTRSTADPRLLGFDRDFDDTVAGVSLRTHWSSY